MRFPWVSRERYEELKERLEKVEAQRDSLLGLTPKQVTQSIVVDENTDLSQVQPIPNKPTLAMITAAANKEAKKRALDPNGKPIPVELAEAGLKGRIDAAQLRKVANEH